MQEKGRSCFAFVTVAVPLCPKFTLIAVAIHVKSSLIKSFRKFPLRSQDSLLYAVRYMSTLAHALHGEQNALMPKSNGRKGRHDKVPPPKPNRKPAYVIYARINPRLGSLFEQFMASRRPISSLKAHLEVAISDYLEKHGIHYEPPPDEGEHE